MVSTIAILLIVFYLFSEGLGLFGSSPLGKKNILVVNKQNSLATLSADQIKLIYDREITNWKELGAFDEEIILMSVNDITDYVPEEIIEPDFSNLPLLLDSLVNEYPGALAAFPSDYVLEDGHTRKIHVDANSIKKFLTGRMWFPTAEPAALYGALPLIAGTFLVSFFAILLALPIGLAAAIYMAEIAPPFFRSLLKPVIELLSGIPSVVYGFFGLVVIVPLIHDFFKIPVGETALAGSIILAIMALPTIITVSEDAIRSTPRSIKEASLALGATRWQTIRKVILPYSISGITAATILGIGRAIGETMAVLMVTGNAAVMPHSLLQPVRTIPATIAAELGEAPQGGNHYQALFILGCLLFLVTLLVNLLIEYISSRRRLLK